MVLSVFQNIISNAIKHSLPGGDITVLAKIETEKVIIQIKDSGIGMSKTDLDKLFKYSVKQTLGTSGEGSTGIGLLLTKEFIDKIGATINIESKIDTGTKFKITI